MNKNEFKIKEHPILYFSLIYNSFLAFYVYINASNIKQYFMVTFLTLWSFFSFYFILKEKIKKYIIIEKGIIVKSIFKERQILWNEIKEVEEKVINNEIVSLKIYMNNKNIIEISDEINNYDEFINLVNENIKFSRNKVYTYNQLNIPKHILLIVVSYLAFILFNNSFLVGKVFGGGVLVGIIAGILKAFKITKTQENNKVKKLWDFLYDLLLFLPFIVINDLLKISIWTVVVNYFAGLCVGYIIGKLVNLKLLKFNSSDV